MAAHECYSPGLALQLHCDLSFRFDLRRFSGGVLWAVLALAVAPAFAQHTSPPQKASTTLELGNAIEREISGRNADEYELALGAGQCASITVDQRGIDVVVSVAGETGDSIAEFDSESRLQSEEHVVVSTESAVRYRLSVKPKYAKAAAGRYLIRVIEIRPATEKDRLLFEAHQLDTQGLALNRKGKFDDARSAATRALEAGEKAVGANDPYVGELLVNLAEAERAKNNLPRSEELFQRAIALDEKALGEENPQTAYAKLRLGALYDAHGEYAKADPLFQQSLAVTERTLGSDHPNVVTCLMNIAALHENREDYGQALPELERARAIAEQQLEPTDFLLIAVLNNLGELYVHTKRFDEAQPLIEHVVEAVEQTRGADNVRLAEPLMNLGIILREKRDYSRALEVTRRGEAIREKAYGAQSVQAARGLISIGNVYRAQGEYAKALETYQQSRRILQTAAGPYDDLTLLTYTNSAIAYSALGDDARAIEEQARADALLEHKISLNLAIGSEREKSVFLQAAAARTDRTISINALLAPDSPAAADLAALVVLQRKGRVLDAMARSFAALRQRMSSDDQKLLDELNAATAHLATVALKGAGKTPPEEYQSQLDSLEKQRNDLEAEISRRSAEFRSLAPTVTIAAVEAAIPPHAALLEFESYHPFDPKKGDSDARAYGDSHYVAYVLRPEGQVRWVELGPAKAIEDAVGAFRAALRDPQRKDVRDLARSLDRKIMQPVRPLLGDAKQLLISPDGELNLIPFDALVDEDSRYLVERYSISYLTTGRDLLRLQAMRSSHSGPVVVADPVFGEPATAEAASVKVGRRTSARTTARRSVTTASDLSGVYFAPLAGTLLEAEAIESQFPGAQLLTGQQATEGALKQVNAPSILHIATHGFFLTDANKMQDDHGRSSAGGVESDASFENPLLRSGLALAGANLNHAGVDNGILTALEASDLNLWGTKLVTLSACDTGVGVIHNGEGVYGLRRAFLLAGAESVVMSLWPVSDYATREMMTSYYKGLKKGMGRAEALRQTKLALLKRKDRQHPFYWASFIESGEWANLDGQRRQPPQD